MKTIAIDALVTFGLFCLLLQAQTEMKAENLMNLGDRFYRNEQYALAANKYQWAAQITPDRFEALRGLANASVKEYDPRGANLRPLFMADWALRQAVTVNPLYPYGWSELGEVAFRLNVAQAPDAPNPETFFRRALEIDPHNPRFLASYMRWQLWSGRRVEAWETFLLLIDSDPVAIRAYGDRFLNSGADIKRLVARIGGNDRQMLQLAELLYQRREYAEVESLIRGLTPEARARSEAAALLASSLRLQDRLAEAEQVLREAIPRDPQNVYLIRDLGKVLALEKKNAEAIAWFSRQLDLNPGQDGLRMDAAAVASQLGEWDRAAEWYDAALNGNRLGREATRQALLGLIEARRHQGKLRDALIAARQLIDLDPENRRYQELGDQVQDELEKQQQTGAAGTEGKP